MFINAFNEPSHITNRRSSIHELKQVETKSEDIRMYLIEAEQSEKESYVTDTLKFQLRYLVILGCLFMKISGMLQTQIITSSFNLSTVNESTLFGITFGTRVISQALFGYLVDLISLRLAFNMTVGLATICQFIGILTYNIENQYWEITSKILNLATNDGVYICGLCMIYDYSFDLKAQFRNSSYFVLFGTFLTNSIVYILQQLHFYSEHLEGSLFLPIISLIFLITGVALLVYVNRQINSQQNPENERYKFFMNRSALSVSDLLQYYFQPDFFYLFAVALMQIDTESITGIFGEILGDNCNGFKEYLNLFYAVPQLTAIGLGLLVLWQLNQRNCFITKSYASIQVILHWSIVAFILVFVVVMLQEQIPFWVLYSVLQIVLIFQSVTSFILYFVCNQMFLCLQEEGITLKGIGLGMIGILQDLSLVTFYSVSSNLSIFLIFFSIVITISIYDLHYQSHHTYQSLQGKLERHFEIRSDIRESLISFEQS